MKEKEQKKLVHGNGGEERDLKIQLGGGGGGWVKKKKKKQKTKKRRFLAGEKKKEEWFRQNGPTEGPLGTAGCTKGERKGQEKRKEVGRFGGEKTNRKVVQNHTSGTDQQKGGEGKKTKRLTKIGKNRCRERIKTKGWKRTTKKNDQKSKTGNRGPNESHSGSKKEKRKRKRKFKGALFETANNAGAPSKEPQKGGGEGPGCTKGSIS